MVVGGGDSAMEEANFLTRFGRESRWCIGATHFRASKIMLERATRNPKIEFLTNTVVEDIYDVEKEHVTGVKLRDLVTGETWEQDVDGFFVAIGHIPNTQPFSRANSISIRTDISFRMAARARIFAGVFHAGDVQDRIYRQAITAAGAGCMAAIEAERFLEAEGK